MLAGLLHGGIPLHRFEFSYVEFAIDYRPHTGEWFFLLNLDPMLGHSDLVCKEFSKSLVLTKTALDDWESLIAPPGPTPFRVSVVIDGKGFVVRIFDETSPEDKEVFIA